MLKGPRNEWTDKQVFTLVAAYGEWNLKVMDAINRRTGHTTINIFRIWYFGYGLNSYAMRLQTAIIHLVVINSIKVTSESGDFCWDIGRFVFCGARVFDGRLGRFNLVVVNFWAYTGRIIMFELLIDTAITDQNVVAILFMLAMQPLVWGDSAGEIVGSFFGQIRFKVYGFGDINEKSVEGTAAVFIASFVSMCLVYYVMMAQEPASMQIFTYHPVVVFAYTCVVATFVEVASPRARTTFFSRCAPSSLFCSALVPPKPKVSNA